MAAQPAGADPHVVHRLVVVGPHPGVAGDDRLDLLGQVGEEGVGRLRARLRDGRPHVVTEHPVELRAGVAPRQSVDPVTLRHLVEQRVAAPVELDLDLPPLDEVDRSVPRPPGVDDVVGDDRQPRAAGVEEVTLDPGGPDGGDGVEAAEPDPAPHHVEQLGRHLVAVPVHRCGELEPLVVAAGELQVPARVVAAGAAPEGGAVAGQAEVGRVVVGRLELRRDRLADPVDPADADEIGRAGRLAELELPLDLCMRSAHAPSLPPKRRSCHPAMCRTTSCRASRYARGLWP